MGVVLLLYADKFVDDLRSAASNTLDTNFVWTWDLLRVLMWVLVAWLFVDAGLTVALSFTEHKYTLADVMRRMERIEAKLGIPPETDSKTTPEESTGAANESTPSAEQEAPAPPPPRD